MLGELFDPKGELLIQERFAPALVASRRYPSSRLFAPADSIPREVLRRWEHEKNDWMQRHGYPQGQHWSNILPTLPDKERGQFNQQFDHCREEYLDTCQGRCLLRRPELATVVADALLHFDGDRYRMGDYVIMPNHVHLLAAFPGAEKMRQQFDSWLHYTAVEINRQVHEHGHFWQQEPFDHLVRSVEQYSYLRKYIADNPAKASLKPGEFLYLRYQP